MDPRKQDILAILSMIGFIVLWGIVTDAWNYSAILAPVQIFDLSKYLYGYLSRVVWVFPAFILICRFEKDLFWSREQLFSKPKIEPVFVTFIVLTTIYAMISMAVNHHSWHVTSENIPLLTIKLFLVGIVEETVFRGWGYNLLKKAHPDTVSSIISALLFVVLHWPAYFIKLLLYGQFNWLGIVTQSISALFCGLLFAVMLKRSATIWNPIAAHFYYDWMLEVFV